jgi:hypothetical protein
MLFSSSLENINIKKQNLIFFIRNEIPDMTSRQSGFRQNRSTADVVWMHKWLIARIMKAKEEILVLGLDMSRAFDMLKRQLLINGLSDIINEDSLRMVHVLLDKTTLQAKIERAP